MAEAKDDIVLSIRGMCKSFGRNRVLDHINLDVKRKKQSGFLILYLYHHQKQYQ